MCQAKLCQVGSDATHDQPLSEKIRLKARVEVDEFDIDIRNSHLVHGIGCSKWSQNKKKSERDNQPLHPR